MRLLLDEDSQSRELVRLLRADDRDVLTVTEADLLARSDSDVLAYAHSQARAIITRNVQDFAALHDYGAEHSGILVEHQDRDPRKNLGAVDVARAVRNLESCGIDVGRQWLSLNAWAYRE